MHIGTRESMIWILKNITVHLWMTTLFAIPLSFYVLPGLTKYFPGINHIILAFAAITGIAASFSFLMALTIKKIIIGLLKEGEAWERSGILKKAEKNYIKILRLYDTFLLWPFSIKKTARTISGAIAKFHLNAPVLSAHALNSLEENPNFKLSAMIYLKINPADKDIAQLWLIKLRKSTIVTSFEQEILSMLAEKYYDDKRLSVLILDILLGLEREDFIAKKLYQNILQNSALKERYAAKIEALIGKPEETLQQQVSFLLPNKKADKKLGRKPGRKIFQKGGLRLGAWIKQIAQTTILSLKSIWTFIDSSLHFLILSVVKIYTFIINHAKIRFYLKAVFLLIISAGLLFFMVNTVSHIFKSKTIDDKKVEVPIQELKPFTIQVAAYLKLKYAQRYVHILKKKKIDAIIKKVDGGGKTWFVVRISEFIDKKSAAAYGKKLKQQKIIDDFFVNNK